MNHDGWTLIELLVVLVILSIILSMTTLSSGLFENQDRIVRQYVLNLHNKLQLAQNQAIMRQQVLQFTTQKNSTGFYILTAQSDKPTQTLRPLTNDRLLDFETIPNNTLIVIESEQGNLVTLYPSGELNTFTLRVYFQNKVVASIKGIQSGDMDVSFNSVS